MEMVDKFQVSLVQENVWDDIERIYEHQAPIEKEEVGVSSHLVSSSYCIFFFWQISYSSLPYWHENGFNNGLYCHLGAKYIFIYKYILPTNTFIFFRFNCLQRTTMALGTEGNGRGLKMQMHFEAQQQLGLETVHLKPPVWFFNLFIQVIFLFLFSFICSCQS